MPSQQRKQTSSSEQCRVTFLTFSEWASLGDSVAVSDHATNVDMKTEVRKYERNRLVLSIQQLGTDIKVLQEWTQFWNMLLDLIF